MRGQSPFVGQLDRKITIAKEVRVQNTSGELKPSLQTVLTPFAKMDSLKGDEDVEGKVRYLIDRKYTIRYHAEIATSGFQYKVIDGAQTFRVTNVVEIGRKNYLELYVTSYE